VVERRDGVDHGDWRASHPLRQRDIGELGRPQQSGLVVPVSADIYAFPMETVSDLVAQRGRELLSLLDTLLRDHSELYLWDTGDSGIFHTSGKHAYRNLSPEGKQLQSRLFEEYRAFADLVGALLREQPDQASKSHDKHRQSVLAAIEREGLTWHRSIDEEWNFASKALQAQIDSIENLYSASGEGDVVVVPDTNALLWNATLEERSFEWANAFELCLVPAVPNELDSLKVNHRNGDVRERAEGLIRRIKGYRDRGNLRDGVPFRKGVSCIRSIAVEPDFDNSLPWLDPANSDDRLVATFIEVMRGILVRPWCSSPATSTCRTSSSLRVCPSWSRRIRSDSDVDLMLTVPSHRHNSVTTRT
jgi:hypothetical protein